MTQPPLVSPDVDLRDFGFMPVDIGRLFGSRFHSASTDGEWRAGMTLWLKSYHQVPAASVPDDDVDLARLAEFGRDVKAWLKVKQGALRGWIKCDDGRLYHPVVAEKALEGWLEKLGQRKSSAAGNAKRYNQTFDAAPYDAAIETALGMLLKLNPSSRLLARRLPKQSQRAPDGSNDGSPDSVPSRSQGTGKGREGKGSSFETSSNEPRARDGETPFERFWAAWPHRVKRKAAEEAFAPVADKIEAILAGVKRYLANRVKDQPWPDPANWLNDQRWEDEPASRTVTALKGRPSIDDKRRGLSGFYHLQHTPQGQAWNDQARREGRSQVWDADGGWPFPSEWPPGHERSLGAG